METQVIQQPATPTTVPPAFLQRPDVFESAHEPGLFMVKVCKNCQSSILNCICDAPADGEAPIYRIGQGLNRRLAHYLQTKKLAHQSEQDAYAEAYESGETDATAPRTAEEMRARINVWPAAPAAAPTPLSFFQSIAVPLAARGLKVTPVNGKVAFLPEHHKEATSDIAKIMNAWAQYKDCNVAVHCLQEEGGVIVVDRDSKLVDLWKEYAKGTGRPKPVSYEVQSTPPCAEYPFGKSHLYFYQTPRTRELSGNISESITGGLFSLRLKNYYVAGEGSVHPDHGGKYTAISTAPIVAMPDELLEWLLSKAATSDKKPATLEGHLIPYGQHDTELFRIACNLRRAGAEEDAIYDALCEICQKRCVGYGDDWQDMCRNKARSAMTYPVAKPDPPCILKGQDLSNKMTTPAPVQPAAPVTQAWGTPQPFKQLVSPVLPFKTEFLPVSVRPWVTDVSERMSVPLDFAGICCLVVLAGVTNRRAFVYPKAVDKDWKEALAMSGAVVASSGKTKTPTWKVFTNPLLEVEAEWQQEYAERAAEYERELNTWKEAEKTAQKAKKDAAKKAAKKPKKSGQPLFDSAIEDDEVETSGPMPARPEDLTPCRRLMTNDATPEKFHILASENAEGLFVYRDELSGWVAELDQDNRAAEREMFLLAMTGNDSFTLDRVERGTVSAVLSASLFGGFQPDMFIEVLSNLRNVSDGTLPRFGLLVYPDDVDLPLIDRAVDDSAKQRYRSIIRALAVLRAESVFLNFAPDAQSIFTEWHNHHTKRVNELPEGGFKSHLAKYKGLLPKLAGLLQLVDIVDKEPFVAGYHLIDVNHLRSALELLRYLESHAVRTYGCIKSPLAKTEAALAMHLQNGDLKDGFTVRTIKRKHWMNLSADGDVEDALQTFQEMNWIRTLPDVQQGRPTVRWEINPRTKEESWV